MFLSKCIDSIGIFSKLKTVLYKKWKVPNLKKTIFQLIMPRKLITKFWKSYIILQVGTLASIKRLTKYGGDFNGQHVNRMWKNGAKRVKSV